MRVPPEMRLALQSHLTEDQRRNLRAYRRRLGRPLLVARAQRKRNLDVLARLHGTDKSSWVHGYASLYQAHFSARRTKVRRVLEIGVGGTTSASGYETAAGGQSLKMWADYFPKAEIVGVDIHTKDIRAPRIHVHCGDQADPEFLRWLGETYGPFDIVIDDGSHIGRHVIASMAGLWQSVRPGGFYVVEDLAVAYHADWGGGPPGTAGTAVALLKGKIDETLLRYGSAYEPLVAEMHIYGEIAFLRKALAR